MNSSTNFFQYVCRAASWFTSCVYAGAVVSNCCWCCSPSSAKTRAEEGAKTKNALGSAMAGDFVSVLPTSRQSSTRTPWKRGVNAVEAWCERQERRANAVKTSCKLHGTPHRTPQNAVRTP